MANTINPSYMHWLINGAWNSFTSAGHMNFTWTEVTASFHPIKRYITSDFIQTLFRSIHRVMKNFPGSSYKVIVKTGNDLGKKEDKVMTSIRKYAEVYNIDVEYLKYEE